MNYELKKDETLPWIEKHRPSKIYNVKLDDHIKKQIKKMIINFDIPNLILEGPPGVGKTSTIKCIAKEIYKKYYEYMVLEMNASDDRGIKIQESIENFRKAFVYIAEEDKLTIPTFKMVILDEADNMTDKAKYIISGFIKNCIDELRFAFTCNTKDNIISSIQSGCHIIKYPPLNDNIIKLRLKEICIHEGILKQNMNSKDLKIIDDGLNAIIQITNGDLRFAINILQLTYNRFDSISSENIFEIQDKPHPQKSKDIIIACMNGKLDEAIKHIIEMRRKGYSGTDIAVGLRIALRLDICSDIPESVKIECWKCICYASYNISKGLDGSFLQVSACIADMYRSIKMNKK